MLCLIVSIPDLCPLYQFNIDDFEQMVDQMYLTELKFNKANYSETEALFLDLYIMNDSFVRYL